MTDADRQAIVAFIEAANNVRALFERARSRGKQQVPIDADAVRHFLGMDVRPEAWMHFGAMMAGAKEE
jgi:hypothetical protein